MRTFSDLINKEADQFADQQEGYKKYPNAKYAFTREIAEEYSRKTMKDILTDPYFLGKDIVDGLWPKIIDTALELEEERKRRFIHTFLFTGSVGQGKTSMSNILLFKQLFDILTIPDIGTYFPNMTKGKAIAFVILSKDAQAAKGVTFKDMLPILSDSPFLRDYFPPNISAEKIMENPSRLPKELRFPKNIVIFPGQSGQAASALGYNVYGCFTGDTKIKMADGSLKSLSELEGKRNLKIRGLDYNPVDIINVDAFTVKQTKVDYVYEVETSDGYKFKTTRDHLFLTDATNQFFRFQTIHEIIFRCKIVTDKINLLNIHNIKLLGKEKVYDVIGSETSNFILENGVIAHNSTMDEVNDMQYVEKSKKAALKQYYSAAEEAHRELYDRMNSRFPFLLHRRRGIKTGLITCIGQARHPDSFTEKMIKKAKSEGDDSGIFYVKKSRWEMQPSTNFLGEKFIFDKDIKKIIEIKRRKHVDLGNCEVCNKVLTEEAMVANENKLVCSLECYAVTYNKVYDAPNILSAIGEDFELIKEKNNLPQKGE